MKMIEAKRSLLFWCPASSSHLHVICLAYAALVFSVGISVPHFGRDDISLSAVILRPHNVTPT